MQQLLFTTYANRFYPWRKKRFRAAIIEELQNLGYEPVVDKSILGTNIYFGNINSDFVLTAHYDTATNMTIIYPFIKYFGLVKGQFVVLIPFLILTLFAPTLFMAVAIIFLGLLLVPNRHNFNDNTSGVYTVLEHARLNKDSDNFFYALTDNEEKGLLGAKALQSYLKKNNRFGKIKNINIDCVAVGDTFAITSTSTNTFLNQSHTVCKSVDSNILKCSSKMMSSDHLLFGMNGIMITKLNKSKYLNDYYIPNIHTNMDKLFDKSNIDITIELIQKITGES